jgi:dTDP-4-amino-4,6-dideoxygalactose transaminase
MVRQVYTIPSHQRASSLSREVLSLPIFPELREEEQDRVVAAVRSFAVRGPESGLRPPPAAFRRGIDE